MSITKSTITTYEYNERTRELNIPFDYLRRDFVFVSLSGKGKPQKTLKLGVDYRFTSKTEITILREYQQDEGFNKIIIRRVTDATKRIINFQDGSILNASELNISQLQSLHVAEEARVLSSYTLFVDDEGNLDARGRKIINLGEPSEKSNDAVSVNFIEGTRDTVLGARDETLKAKEEACKCADSAKQSETNSKSSEDKAEQAKQASLKAQEASEEAKQIAQSSATTSQQSAKSALSSKEAAKNSETVSLEAAKRAEDAAEVAVGGGIPMVNLKQTFGNSSEFVVSQEVITKEFETTVLHFNTVNDLINSKDVIALNKGSTIVLNGRNTLGDGGGGIWITSTKEEDPASIGAPSIGNVVASTVNPSVTFKLSNIDGYLTSKQLGLKGDGITDDTKGAKFIENLNVPVRYSEGTYVINEDINKDVIGSYINFLGTGNVKVNDTALEMVTGVKYEKKRLTDTDCWFIDTGIHGKHFKLGLSNDTPDNNSLSKLETPIEFSHRKSAVVAVNAGLFDIRTSNSRGIVIQNGKILKNETPDLGIYQQKASVLYSDMNGMLKSVNTTEANATSLLEQGALWAIQGWFTLAEGGVITPAADRSNTNPLMLIAQRADGSIIFVTADARNEYNSGVAPYDLCTILINEYKATFIYQLDGGGSTTAVVRGVRINRVSDNNGTKVRPVSSFIYSSKSDNSTPRSDIAKDISNVKEVLSNEIINKTDVYGVLKIKAESSYPVIDSYSDGNYKSRVGRLDVQKNYFKYSTSPAVSGYKMLTSMPKIGLSHTRAETVLIKADSSGLYDSKGLLGDYHSKTSKCSDLDSAYNTGTYYVDSNTKGIPNGVILGTVSVILISGKMATQMVINKDRQELHIRTSNSAGNWSGWRKI